MVWKGMSWIDIGAKLGRSAISVYKRFSYVLDPDLPRKSGPFTPEEDALIIAKRHSLGLRWDEIAKFLPGRSICVIANRYRNYLDPALNDRCWTKEEDEILLHHQRILGNKWAKISKFLPGKSLCRIRQRFEHLERTRRHFKAKGAWTEQEDRILQESQRMLGNRWNDIAKLLPGRSPGTTHHRFEALNGMLVVGDPNQTEPAKEVSAKS
jgi:hypothetical protein